MSEAIFELLVPLVMAAVIDKGIAGNDIPYIIKMCLVMVALGIVGLISSVTAQYFSAKAAAGFGTQVRHALFILYQLGSGGYVHVNYKNDQRCQSGAEWCKYGAAFVFAVTVYCVWRDGDGIYD